MRDLYTVILAGGEGSRLSFLSERRAKPAVPFGGKYRIIDFPLSNCVNSRIYDVAILTQYRPHSLNNHIGRGDPWDLDRKLGGAEIWQPHQGPNYAKWYQGTADALYQNLMHILPKQPKHLLILSGDHIYKMDYSKMYDFHIQKEAALTIAVMSVPQEEASRFGIMSIDENRRIIEFEEKPAQPKSNLASMGIYIFHTETLQRLLQEDAAQSDSHHDFGENIIPQMIAQFPVFAYQFEGYWRDVGTIQSLWECNMDLLSPETTLNLFEENWQIYTRSTELPPTKFNQQAEVSNSLLSNGCIINGRVRNSVLSPGVVVEEGAEVIDSILFNDVHIGANSRIEQSILDKYVHVGHASQIGMGDANVINADHPHHLNTGITIIGRHAQIGNRCTIGKNCSICPESHLADDCQLASGESL